MSKFETSMLVKEEHPWNKLAILVTEDVWNVEISKYSKDEQYLNILWILVGLITLLLDKSKLFKELQSWNIESSDKAFWAFNFGIFK